MYHLYLHYNIYFFASVFLITSHGSSKGFILAPWNGISPCHSITHGCVPHSNVGVTKIYYNVTLVPFHIFPSLSLIMFQEYIREVLFVEFKLT
jgi:hypothetical protein